MGDPKAAEFTDGTNHYARTYMQEQRARPTPAMLDTLKDALTTIRLDPPTQLNTKMDADALQLQACVQQKDWVKESELDCSNSSIRAQYPWACRMQDRRKEALKRFEVLESDEELVNKLIKGDTSAVVRQNLAQFQRERAGQVQKK
jgi:hypothetical protein